MKKKQSKVTRRSTMALSAIMLSEQLAGTGAVLYAHAEDEIKNEYKIEHNVTASWDGGCNANIILTNLADRETQDWSITFCTEDKIESIWGGTITECLEINKAEELEETKEDEESAEAEEAFEDIFEEAFEDEINDEFEDELVDVHEEDFNNEESLEDEFRDTTDDLEEVEETTEDETEVDEEELSVESQEYSYDAPAVEGAEVYYQYTVDALDYNAVIAAGESVTIGYSAVGSNHDIWDEKAEITYNESAELVGGTYVYDGYTVEVVIPSNWSNTYNVKLLITNTSEKTIHNWAFVMETKDTISGLYNATELSNDDGVRLIKNTGYNQDIAVGGSLEVGYTATYEGKFDVPNSFALSQIEKEVAAAECEVSLLLTDEWEDGGLAQILIENKSDMPIEDWSLEFDSALEIVDIWGAVIANHDGEHYSIQNVDYTQNIPAGETCIVGILFSGEFAEIRNIEAKKIMINGIDVAVLPATEEIDYETDTDEDGIPDDIEKLIGTDPLSEDTDEDELSDYLEVFIIESDPLVWDSITSGVSDGDADCDEDGISNKEEQRLGTNPLNKDTDGDGLDDIEEIEDYGTDPLKRDTDDDGIEDADELKLGLDPTNPVTYGVKDSEYPILQTIDANSDVFSKINTADNAYQVSVDIEGAGYLEGSLEVKESDYSVAIENDAMIGTPLQLHYDFEDTVESVTLNFKINDSYVAGGGILYPEMSELKGLHRYNVFHYFEDKNMLLPVETFFDDATNTAYAETDELGTYCLMDMEKVFARLDSFAKTDTVNDYETNRTIEDDVLLSASEIVYPTTPIETENGLVMGASIVREGEGAELPDVLEKEGVVRITYMLMSHGQNLNLFNNQKQMILDIYDKLLEEHKEWNIEISIMNIPGAYIPSEFLKDPAGSEWFKSRQDIVDALDGVTYRSTTSSYKMMDSFGLMLDKLNEDIKPQYVIFLVNGNYTFSVFEKNQAVVCNRGVNYCEVFEKNSYFEGDSYRDYLTDKIKSVNGIQLEWSNTATQTMYEHICKYAVPEKEEPVQETDERELVNLYFILQAAGANEVLFENQRKMIPELLEKLQRESVEYRYRISITIAGEYASSLLLNESNTMWFENPEELCNELMEVSYDNQSYVFVNMEDAFNSLYWYIEGDLGNKNYVFMLHNGKVSYGDENSSDGNPRHFCNHFIGRVNYSEIGNTVSSYVDTDPSAEYPTFVEKTGGKRWIYQSDMVDIVYTHICGIKSGQSEKEEEPRRSFPVISLTGWNVIELAAPPEVGSNIDTDLDGLTDLEEIDIWMLTIENGKYVLPSVNECINSIDKPYVQEGISRFFDDMSEVAKDGFQIQAICKETRVLPIISNPINEDSDGDGIYDAGDIRRLVFDDYPDLYDELINKKYIDMNKMCQTEDGFTICMTPIADIYRNIGFDGYVVYTNIDEDEHGDYTRPDDFYLRDWYLYSVSKNDEVAYSILKLRTYNSSIKATPGVSIPFASIDVSVFDDNTYLDNDHIEFVKQETRRVIVCNSDQPYNGIIINYFYNSTSDALYELADIYVGKVIEDELGENETDENCVKAVLPGFEETDYQKTALSKCNLYDESSKSIKIADSQILSQVEKEAILSCRTNNPNYDSFAAEIVFHAEATLYVSGAIFALRIDPTPNSTFGWEAHLVDSLIADWLKKEFYASGIKADLSIDDKETSSMEEWFFKSENSPFLIYQRAAHMHY